MDERPTHASFFSGVGGLDLGLERAGWRTVSFSEIDPYASAVLARHWPGVPNLGDITALRPAHPHGHRESEHPHGRDDERAWLAEHATGRGPWTDATLWTGGFPCQDLSVAGKRAGLAGERSGLAFAFLDLVERHRPPLLVLENVPGLLSSHGGRDLGVLLHRLADIGYGWAFRILDSQFCGVPQRRRRVYIVGVRCGDDDPDGRVAAERAGQVLAVGTRCGRDHQAEREARADVAEGTGRGIANAIQASAGHHGHSSPRGDGSDNLVFNASAKFGQWDGPDDAAGTLSRRDYKSSNHLIVDGPPPDADRVRATDGIQRRSYDRGGVEATDLYHQRDRIYSTTAPTLDSHANASSSPLAAFVKAGRAQTSEDGETWKDGDVMPTLNSFDVGDTRTTAAIIGQSADSDLDPLGLDSHRYRCCGNGVAAPVAEWLGMRLLAYLKAAP